MSGASVEPATSIPSRSPSRHTRTPDRRARSASAVTQGARALHPFVGCVRCRIAYRIDQTTSRSIIGGPVSDHDEEEALDAPLEQRREPEAAAREQVHAPDDRLDAVDALEPVRLPVPVRERIPRAGERSGERSPDRSRDEERDAPRGVRQHRLRQIDRRAVRGETDGGLNDDEREREPDEQPVAAGAALVEVDRGRTPRPPPRFPPSARSASGPRRRRRTAGSPRAGSPAAP